MTRATREIAWIKAARKAFESFPRAAQLDVRRQLTAVAEGQRPDDAKPLKGLGGGVFEIALRHRTNAYRTVYAVELDEAIWVIHAFQKKSPSGIRTAKKDVDLIRERLRRLKDALT